MTLITKAAACFDSRFKFAVHVNQCVLVIIGIILAIVALTIPGGTMTRALTMALGMGAKSLVILAYQLVTEHSARFAKWGSLKANAILNSMEIVFWSAVFYLTIASNQRYCVGAPCIVSKVLAANAFVIV
ncbi:hypothetical protein SLS62_010726 [Diatrype stigma]|uniref:Uncharacterized protein n=1 Tax=Diatrype stigma TaxID=117547 RepID=A0AAN9YHD0_9PEZI